MAYNITISRKTGVYGWLNSMNIIFNGEVIGKIKNNQTCTIEIPKESGTVQVAFLNNPVTEEIHVTAGQKVLISNQPSNKPKWLLFLAPAFYLVNTKITASIVE